MRNDFASGHIHTGQHRLGPMAHIFIGPTAWFGCPQGQHGLIAIQRLDAGFLIHAQYYRVVGWVHVQSHYLQQLLTKLGIRTKGKCSQPMRLQLVLLKIRSTVAKGTFRCLARVRTLQRSSPLADAWQTRSTTLSESEFSLRMEFPLSGLSAALGVCASRTVSSHHRGRSVSRPFAAAAPRPTD
jgi:hypothetical protein